MSISSPLRVARAGATSPGNGRTRLMLSATVGGAFAGSVLFLAHLLSSGGQAQRGDAPPIGPPYLPTPATASATPVSVSTATPSAVIATPQAPRTTVEDCV